MIPARRAELTGDRRDITYLSLGAGVQSTALLVISNLGLYGCPKADLAIFADTGAEFSWVYENLERLMAWSKIPVEVVTCGKKIDAQTGKFVTAPFFTRTPEGDSSPLRRQCTREFKIEPLERRVKQAMGYSKGQRVKHSATALIGISLDEYHRMKASRTPWVKNTYPLVDARLTRKDCIPIIESVGLPRPLKSSCYFCPYHSDEMWKTIKDHFPQEWNKAVEFDSKVREWRTEGLSGGRYLHKSLKPIDQIDFTKGGQARFDFFDEECEGMCGL